MQSGDTAAGSRRNSVGTVIAALSLAITGAIAQPVMFQKAIGGSKLEYCYAMLVARDSGYILGGVSLSYGGAYAAKVDYRGTLLWTKTYFDGTPKAVNDMVYTADHGFFISGWGIVGLKCDSTGTVQWNTVFSRADAYPSIQTHDLGYLVSGYILNAGNVEDIPIIKLTPGGDTVWTKIYGGAGVDWTYSIVETKDQSAYLIAGYTTSFGAGGKDVLLVKIDLTGAVLWAKTYGGSGDEYAFGHCLQQTSDSGFIMTGQGWNSAFLIKTDKDGNLSWAKTYGCPAANFGHEVQQTADNGYILAGETMASGTCWQAYLVKTDANGNLQWSKTYGGNSGVTDCGWIVKQTADKGYAVSGFTNSFGTGEDMYLIKTDSLGNSGCHETAPATIVGTPSVTQGTAALLTYSYGMQITHPAVTTLSDSGLMTTVCQTTEILQPKVDESVHDFSITMDPVTAVIMFNSPMAAPITAGLYDTRGRLVKQLTDRNYGRAADRVTWNVSGLPAGVYFCTVKTRSGTFCRKIVRLK